MVTSTFRFFASASEAATMILIEARSRYFFVGKSAAEAGSSATKKHSNAKSRLRMAEMLPIAHFFCQLKWREVGACGKVSKWCTGGFELPTFWFVASHS